MSGEVFLSLFGGVGAGAHFVGNQGGGGRAILVDIDFSDCNDLGRPSRWSDVFLLPMQSSIVGIDLPCNTWSRARRAPWWSKMPSALRSDACIFGIPNLKESDQRKVTAANHMVRQSVRLIRWCVANGRFGESLD